MASRRHPELGFRSCVVIIDLGRKYGDDRLEAACRRTLCVGSHSYRSGCGHTVTGGARSPQRSTSARGAPRRQLHREAATRRGLGGRRVGLSKVAAEALAESISELVS
jgi:hypothetical protein